jgi:hypothetical protein
VSFTRHNERVGTTAEVRDAASEPGSICRSCGHRSATVAVGIEPPVAASVACYAAYLELSTYNAERARLDFLHQAVVDAYTAQHPNPPTKPISVWFALVGLHLFIDQDRTGQQVQRAHSRLARRAHHWEPIAPPGDLTGFTAGDVLRHAPGHERDAAEVQWAKVVWARWADQHEVIASLCRQQAL